MKVLWFILVLPLLLGSLTAVARDVDIKGASDHPLISRFPDTYISAYHMSDFQEFMVAVGPITPEILAAEGKTALPPVKRYEGKSTVITYKSNSKSTSAFAIYRNFEKAFEANGFVETFACAADAECGDKFVKQLYWRGDPARQGQNTGFDAPNVGNRYNYYYWTGTGKAESGNYVISLLVAQQANASFPPAMVLDISEVEALDEDRVSINLAALGDDIRSKGKAVLNGIFFDFDKSTLTAESKNAIAVIASYLEENIDMTFYVVGHTDGKGGLEYNQSLSLARAKAVVEALSVSHGIEARRLTALGIGPASPVTSNARQDGRDLNRRVELVLQN